MVCATRVPAMAHACLQPAIQGTSKAEPSKAIPQPVQNVRLLAALASMKALLALLLVTVLALRARELRCREAVVKNAIQQPCAQLSNAILASSKMAHHARSATK